MSRSIDRAMRDRFYLEEHAMMLAHAETRVMMDGSWFFVYFEHETEGLVPMLQKDLAWREQNHGN